MSWFNREKKEKKEQQKQQLALLRNVSTLTRFAKAGMLFIDMKEKKVIISTSLSMLFLNDRTRWVNFLQNVQYWFVYKVSQLMWNQLFLDAEVKAVREARKKYPNLTKLQEAEIRRKARTDISMTELEPPKIEPFEFILSTDISSGAEPEVFAVGRFENGAFDMVTFESVQASQIKA